MTEYVKEGLFKGWPVADEFMDIEHMNGEELAQLRFTYISHKDAIRINKRALELGLTDFHIEKAVAEKKREDSKHE